jgi:nucleotide-binding universal stress UspA family protein
VETIVVGVDGSQCSLAALRFAVREARVRRARLRVVHAWAVPPVSTYHEAEHAIRTDFDRMHDEAKDWLDGIVEEALGAEPDVEVEKALVEGPPAAALVAAAKDAALLVVGSRGLGGFKALLLGSVGQHCAHHATCPIVIVRGDAPD